MRINHNLSAINTNNKLKNSNNLSSKGTEKLSSGLRINRAADDAAGLAISEQMRAQIRGLQRAGRNIQDGISLIHTADGGYEEITNIIQRQRELIVQGMNGTYSEEDKRNIELEINQLSKEITSIAKRTGFNTMNLLARDDYMILEDRSSSTVNTTISGPFPPTKNTEQTTLFLPKNTTEVPFDIQSSNTTTTTDDEYRHESHVTPITSPDGRPGYNDYEKNDHIHTVTTATDTTSFGRELVSDTRYKELDIKNMGVQDVFFQTQLIPSGTLAGQYPDFGGIADRFTVIEMGSDRYTLSDFTLTASNIASDSITATYEKDGIEVEKKITISPDGSEFQAEFKIINNSGINDKSIKVSTVFEPRYNGSYTIESSNGVPIGATASQADIPNSGTVFELTNDLVDYEFSFLSGGNYMKPDSLTTNSDKLESDTLSNNDIRPEWGKNVFVDGDVLEFGIKLSNFNFKKDVFRVKNESTHQVIEVVETVKTDITDIDYIPPKLDIQVGDKHNDKLSIPLFNLKADGLGIANIGILPPSIPEQSLSQADQALSRVTNYRSIHGALQNRLEHTLINVGNYSENLTAAESRIRDADMAKEMMDLTKSNIQTQAAQAMLAQAKVNPQMILQLLQ